MRNMILKWPVRYRVWRFIHLFTSRMAWRFADPGGPELGKALRVNEKHPLWRINRFVGHQYIPWYLTQRTGYNVKRIRDGKAELR